MFSVFNCVFYSLLFLYLFFVFLCTKLTTTNNYEYTASACSESYNVLTLPFDEHTIPKRKGRTEGPEGVTESMIKSFSDALLRPELFRDMREELYADNTLTKFKEAIKVQNTNTSFGHHRNMLINMLKMWDCDIIGQIIELLSTIWKERHIPESWKHKWVMHIPKVQASQVPIDKRRPICLLETMRKVWTGIITSKISHNATMSYKACKQFSVLVTVRRRF